MAELNPNHEVTKAMRGQWHAIALILMQKMGVDHVEIDLTDIQKAQGKAIAVQEKDDRLHIQVMTVKEAELLARKQGGMPH